MLKTNQRITNQKKIVSINEIYLSISTNKVRHNNFILINSMLHFFSKFSISSYIILINFTHEKKISNLLIKIITQDLNKITVSIQCIEGDATNQENTSQSSPFLHDSSLSKLPKLPKSRSVKCIEPPVLPVAL